MRFLTLTFLLLLMGCAKPHDDPATAITIGPDSTPRDFTVGQSSTCEIHHIQMQRTSVRVVYGLLRSSSSAQARYEASKTAFPHAETWVGGGCVVAPGISATNAFIFTCPECKKAASKWDSQHDYH
jgi:hypothetical protein